MSLVNVNNMLVLDNPTNFSNPFQFEITFECLQELEEDLEWKVIYVGKAASTDADLVLDEILVGPIPVGINKFVLSADAPETNKLDKDEILGVTVVLVTCSYREREFIRIGYYVNNEYSEEYDHEKEPPPPLDLTKVSRHILADKPRVTKFNIAWTKEDENKKPVSDNVATTAPVEGKSGDSEPMEEDLVLDDKELDAAEEEEEEDDEPEGDEAEEVDITTNE